MTVNQRIDEELKAFGLYRKSVDGQIKVVGDCACGAHYAKHFPPTAHTDMIIKFVAKKGWGVSHKHDPMCPDCVREHDIQKRAAKKKAATITTLEPKEAEPMTVPTRALSGEQIPPPSSTLDMKTVRQIMTALTQHFNEQKGLYQPEWSDARIAMLVRLNVADVAQVREEAFGKLMEDPDVAQMKKTIQGLRDRISKFEEDTLNRLTTELAPLKDTVALLEKKLARVRPGEQV